MTLAIAFLEEPLIVGYRVVDRRQQRKQLGGPPVFHRRTGQHPDGPETGMTRQTQQRIRALCLEGLRVMRFINDQQRPRWGKTPGQLGPADQLNRKIQG